MGVVFMVLGSIIGGYHANGKRRHGLSGFADFGGRLSPV